MMEIVKVEFNYQVLDAESRIVVQQRTSEIRSLVRRSAQDIFDIGQKLIEVKEKLQHGQFLNWLDMEFGWEERTAQRFMSVAIQFKSDNLSDLIIAPSALYLLAAPSTEPETRQQFIEQAKTEPVTHKQVKQAVKEYGYSKAQQTKLPPKIKSAFTASPPALDDFNQAGYDEFSQTNYDDAGFVSSPGNGYSKLHTSGGQFASVITEMEAAGYTVIPPTQANNPNCPYCGRKF